MAVNKLKGTPAQLEQITGIKQAQLSVLLRMAENAGVAKVVGYDGENYKGRGRIPKIWELPEEFKIPVSLKKQEQVAEK
jgi:predicted transcriptional regulator